MAQAAFHTQDESLVRNLLILDGFSRAGKYFLGKIVAGLANTDFFQSISALEHIPFIHRLGGITDDAAVALFRKIVDENAYNIRIGRNLNTRVSDASSIYNSPDIGEYLRRSVSAFGEISLSSDQILDSFRTSGRWSVFLTHETLPNAGFLFKAYPGLRMINLIRHPVDVMHSWYLRGWGRRFGGDPLSFVPTVNGPAGPVPWHANAYREAYAGMGEADRVIHSISELTNITALAYAGLDQARRGQILFVRYEDLVEKPQAAISAMAGFLGTQAHDGMRVILARERCPGSVSQEKRARKASELRANSSAEAAALLDELSANYEKRANPYEAAE